MKAGKLYIGAFALIVCAIAAFAVTSADSADAESTADVGGLAADINGYFVEVLGTDKVVTAAADNNGLTVTVDTSLSAIQSMDIDLGIMLTNDKFKDMDVVYAKDDADPDGIKIIENGKPAYDLGTLISKIASALKTGIEDDSVKYTGQIKVNNNEYKTFEVIIILTKESRDVAKVLTNMSGLPSEMTVEYHITDGVFKAFGIPADKIGETNISDVFSAFANGKGASVIFDSSSTANYFDTMCDKINKADKLAEFLSGNIQVKIDGTSKTISDVQVSTTYGFKGLMSTLSSATSQFGTVNDCADVDGGTVSFETITIAIKNATTTFYTIGINMDVIYSDYEINVYAEASEGGTATIGGKDSITGYAGTPFTVTATPDSGYTISSIEYYVGDEKVDSLGSSTRTNTFIHFEEGLAHFVVVTFKKDTPAPPTPVPPTPVPPDDPEEPEDLPEEGTVVNPDGSTTTTVTDEETGTKSSITEKNGSVTEVVSQTEFGTKYSSVGEGSTVTTTLWSDDLDADMVTALVEQADMITGGRTAELVVVSTEVTIDANVADDVADAFRTVTLTNADAHMEIPSNVVKNLAKDGEVKITSKQAASSDMTDKQKSVVGNNYVLRFSATAGTTTVHELGDEVTISFNYTPTVSMSGKHIVVKYVDDDGKTTEMQTTYSNGRVSFVTDHFSIYFVDVVENTPGGGGSSTSGNNNIIFVAVAAAAVAAIAVCIAALVYLKKD